jgi:predicted transcriptional regulator
MATLSTTSLKLDTAMKERVHRLASARRRSPHWVMREAVEQYVEREEKREQLRQDALAAWAAYQATGLHVTAEEADAWLAKLEAGKHAVVPKCHV